MKKERKTNTTRKPPRPVNDHTIIEEWMARVMPELNPIVKEIDELICKKIPDLQYAIKWGKVYYGLPELGWIIEMVSYNVSVNIVFHGGAGFDSPPPLGSDGRARYIKFKNLDEVKSPEFKKWIEQASSVPGWR